MLVADDFNFLYHSSVIFSVFSLRSTHYAFKSSVIKTNLFPGEQFFPYSGVPGHSWGPKATVLVLFDMEVLPRSLISDGCSLISPGLPWFELVVPAVLTCGLSLQGPFVDKGLLASPRWPGAASSELTSSTPLMRACTASRETAVTSWQGIARHTPSQS